MCDSNTSRSEQHVDRKRNTVQPQGVKKSERSEVVHVDNKSPRERSGSYNANQATCISDRHQISTVIFVIHHIRPKATSLGVHLHEQPRIARKLASLRIFIKRRQRKADPAQIFGECIARSGVGVAIDAHNEAIAGKVVDFAEFEEGHESISCQRLSQKDGTVHCDIPSLEVTSNNSLVEEHKHCLLSALLRHEPAEAHTANVIPHLDAVADDTRVPCEERVLGRDAIIALSRTMHTHRKRVLARQSPLTQENSAQCLAEESLTLSRDGMCSPRLSRYSRRSRGT
jgi:hypothetical protein